MTPPLPDLLTLDDLMARYGLRDRRTARWIARAAGSLRVAGRVLVPVDRLAEWERAQAESPGPPLRTGGRAKRRVGGRAPDPPEKSAGAADYWFWDDAA